MFSYLTFINEMNINTSEGALREFTRDVEGDCVSGNLTVEEATIILDLAYKTYNLLKL